MSHAFTTTRIPKTLTGIVLGCCLIFTSTGVQSATANSVTLQWAANSEPDLRGYNVYKGITPGVYGPSVDVGNTMTYTARDLQAGVRYYFAITAYDNNGNESPPSIEVSRQTSFPPPPAAWEIAGVADLDGEGKADVIWRNTDTGDVGVWLGNGVNAPTTLGVLAEAVPAVWKIAGVGDLNGDGKADIVWRNTDTRDVAGWLMNGLTIGSTGVLAGAVSAVWGIADIGDLGGDGRADIVWRNMRDGSVGAWLGNGLTLGSTGVLAGSLP
jgi:hypothetical protein